MKIIIFFSSNFCNWPTEIIRSIQKDVPDVEVIALATDNHIAEKLSEIKDVNISKVHNLDSFEKEWIKNPLNVSTLQKLEAEIGRETLLNTVIADKNLGSGFINGAIIHDAEISKLTVSNDALKSYISGLYTFLLDLYEKEKPDLTLVYTIAGALTYAIGKTAKIKSCPFVRFQHSRIDNIFILDDSLRGLTHPVKQALEDKDNLDTKIKEAEAWLQNFRQKTNKPSHVELNKKLYSDAMKWSGIIRSMCGIMLRSFKKALNAEDLPIRAKPEKQQFVFKVRSPLIRRLGISNRFFEDFEQYKNENYVYFTLHVDPEASTLVSAPQHINQIAAIEALAKNIPLSSILIVKEHPVMIGKRPNNFYKRISRIPNVVLIKPETDSHEIIRHSSLVATITGTVGWEAMLLHKPVLLMAETPYMLVGEGFVLYEHNLHDAIIKARSIKIASDKALIKYIAAVMSVGIPIPDDLLWRNEALKGDDHSQVSKTIAKRLIKLGK